MTLLTILAMGVVVTALVSAAEPDWNQFRGPNHDNKSLSTGIAKSWPEGGPKLLWRVDHLGAGYSNVSLCGDRLFTLGDIGPDCRLFALDKTTGKTLWSVAIGRSGDVGRYVGPRSTPAVDGKYVFAYTQFGEFVCVAMETGDEVWGGDAVRELGGRYMNNWGFSSSPIFEGDLVIVPVGGTAGSVIAFRKDGRQVWRTKSLTDAAPYNSVVPVDIHGVRQLLFFAETGVAAISPTDGRVLWKAARSTDKAICSDPIVKDDVVFVSQAYGFGSNGYRVTKLGDEWSAAQIYADQRLQNHHGGIVLVGDHLYFTTDRNLVCLDIKTGQVAWENRCVGKGSVTYVDGHFIVRSESGDGVVALVVASPTGYQEKGRFAQPERSDKNSWTYPVIADRKLYLRDQRYLFCYDLGE